MTDRERLRELAEEATPGPWLVPAGDDDVYDERQKVCIARYADPWNAAYIAAASPDAILALLADLEAAEERVRAVPDFTPKEWPE